jgi:ribosome-binding factor A
VADPARARRLAKRISTIVASAIEYEIKDPRLAGVTITDAKMTGDLHDATLFYTVFGRTLEDEPDYAGAAAALEKATGVLRTKVGAALGVRFTPTLAFERDTVPDAAHRMEELLAQARAADEDLARVRQGAKHAGDADPYRLNDGVGVPPAGEASGGETGGAPDDAEDTGDRDRFDD